MAVTDYNRTKTLEASSFNDAGATIDKAQAIELVGNDYTGFDGFESGSSELNFESSVDFSIDSNSEVYQNNSLKINNDADNMFLLNSTVSTDGKNLVGSVKIDNQTGNSNDTVGIQFEDFQVNFDGDGTIRDVNGNSLTSWTAGAIYDVRMVVDFSNN